MGDYECCANCKHCDCLFAYVCSMKILNIDDPYSDVCDYYEPAAEEDR